MEEGIITDKFYDSIAKISYLNHIKGVEKFCSGFFIKLKINGSDIPFYCTVMNILEKGLGKVDLILPKKDTNDENFKIDLSLDKSKKKIFEYPFFLPLESGISIIFIEILDTEIPEGLTLSFLELEEKNIGNPINYIDCKAIMAGYPLKYSKEYPFISSGNIIKILEENGIIKVVYNIEADLGSSGSPVCIIDENNELKLIAIHSYHDKSEKDNYNIGIFLGPFINDITNKVIINENNNNEKKNVINTIRYISDEFYKIPSKEFLKDSFIIDEDYQKIIFYHKQILEEYNKQNIERFKVYYSLLNDHILNKTKDLLEDKQNFLLVLEHFKEARSTFYNIKNFNNDIIFCFNKILLSNDYELKSKVTHFISKYIQTLKENDCRYNYRDVKFYQRSIIDLDTLNKIKARTNQTIVNQYFMNEVIPMTRFGNWIIYYKDIKMSLWLSLTKQTMQQSIETVYDTKIYIEQKYENDNQKANIFQIYNWPEVIIAPFSCFRVDFVTINKIEQTAVVKLTLLASENEILEN